MTNDQIRIAIAELMPNVLKLQAPACLNESLCEQTKNKFYIIYGPTGNVAISNFPNYPEDLNACAEFEKEAPDEYWVELANIVGRDNQNSAIDRFAVYIQCMKATPLQRCEAYLRLKRKWNE